MFPESLRSPHRRSLLQRLAGRQRTAAYVVALQLAVEGRPADAEHFARQHLVAFHLLEDTLDGRAFDIFEIGGRESIAGAQSGLVLGRRFGGNCRGQIVDIDRLLVSERDRAFNTVLQFAYIPRPVVLQQTLHGCVGDLNTPPRSTAIQKPMAEHGDVGTTLAQRGHVDSHYIEPEVKILAKCSVARSRLVAAITRTSTFVRRLLPTGRTSFSCSTRSSLACNSSGNSPISSRKIVPPL